MTGLLGGWLLLAVGMSASHSQQYTLNLNHPSRVGDRIEMKATGEEKTETVAREAARVMQEQSKVLNWEMDVSMTVASVTRKRQINGLSLVVNRFIQNSNGETKQLLPPRTQVVASVRSGTEHFEIAGRPPDNETTKALKHFVSLSKTGQTDQDLYGPSTPVRVGQEWKVNSSGLAGELAAAGFKAATRDIAGKVTLDRVAPRNGRPCAEISGRVSMENLSVTPEDKSMWKSIRSDMELNMVFPIDNSSPSLREISTLVFEAVLNDPDRPGLETEIKISKRAQKTFERSSRKRP